MSAPLVPNSHQPSPKQHAWPLRKRESLLRQPLTRLSHAVAVGAIPQGEDTQGCRRRRPPGSLPNSCRPKITSIPRPYLCKRPRVTWKQVGFLPAHTPRGMHITQLNGECLLHLFSFLDKESRKNLAQTCRRLLMVFQEPSLWPLLRFHSPSELTKGNFVLGPALRYLSIRWHSSRVKVCNIEDWLKSAFQRDICSTHEHTVNDFLLQVCQRCPNLLALSLSGCGHVTDETVALLLQSCSSLKTLQLENCVRISNRTLEAAALYADSLQTLQVDFCRNITQAGLQRFREKCPAVTLKAERSADMIPDQKPGSPWTSDRAAKKLLWY